MIRNFLQEQDYAHGYQKALQDVLGFFQRRSNVMKVLHLYNQSGIELILKGMVDNAESMQELGSDIEFEIHEEVIGKKKQFTSIKVCDFKK
jgi:tRNA A37 methylthiotransferase MiaB